MYNYSLQCITCYIFSFIYFLLGSNVSISHFNIAINITNEPIDLSWIEYLNEVYGIQNYSISNNDSQYNLYYTSKLFNNKKRFLFFYEFTKVSIQLFNFPLNHSTHLTKLAFKYRKAFNSNEKFNNHTWVEVSRFASKIIGVGWDEGYSDGAGSILSKINTTRVPYGCWFNPSPGSGIYVNVGKILFLTYINGTCNFGNILMVTSTSCNDKYRCSIALSLGYDSVYNIEEVKDRKFRPPQLTICRDSCGSIGYNGTCPPLILKTLHYDPISSVKSLNSCDCNEKAPMLNCNKSFQLLDKTNITSLYRHTTCISYNNDSDSLYMKSYEFQIILGFNKIIGSKQLKYYSKQKNMLQTMFLLIHDKLRIMFINNLNHKSNYQRIDFSNDNLFNNINYIKDDNILTEIKLSYNIIDIFKVNIKINKDNKILNIGLIIFDENYMMNRYLNENISNNLYSILNIERQLIDAATCLYTVGASPIILIIIPYQQTFSKLKDILSLSTHVKQYIHLIITNSINEDQQQVIYQNSLNNSNAPILSSNYSHYSITKLVKIDNILNITNESQENI